MLARRRTLYRGEPFDADLSAYYLRARYMNPANGRFVTMDTFAGRTRDPLSLHKYLYVHANPVNRVDPSGHFDYQQALVGLNVLGILSNIGQLAYHTYKIHTAATPEEALKHTAYASMNSVGLFLGMFGGGFFPPSGSLAIASGASLGSAVVIQADMVIGGLAIPTAQTVVMAMASTGISSGGGSSGTSSSSTRTIKINNENHVKDPKHALACLARTWAEQKAIIIDTVRAAINANFPAQGSFLPTRTNPTGTVFEGTFSVHTPYDTIERLTIRWFEYSSGDISINTAYLSDYYVP